MVRYLLLISLLLLPGCFTRTVYIPPGKAVMLRQDLKNVKIWALDSKKKRVPGTLKTVPEGWMLVPKVLKKAE